MAKAIKAIGLVVGAAALVVATAGAGAALAAGVSLSAGIGAATAAVGLTSLGLSVGTLALVSGGLTLAAGLLTKAPSIPSSQTTRLTASIDPRAPRKTSLGSTAFPADVRYEEWSGAKQDYCDWIVCVASHAVESAADEIWLNDEQAWTLAGGVAAKYAGYFEVPHLINEGTPGNGFSVATGKWSASSARLTGCAYLHLRFKVTGNGSKAESPFSGGPPSRITIIGRGGKLYDPRRDSSVGGNGPMRADDQSTWRYLTDDGATIGENLPLQILRVLLGWRITNPVTGAARLAVGAGIPAKRIDLSSFMIAASQAEEMVNRATGGAEPRFYGAGVTSEADDPKTTLDAMCAGCCGRFMDTGGRLSLAIAHNDLAAAATDDGLTTGDVIGGFTWDPDPALEQTPNVVRGRYVDATPASLYQLIDYPEVRLPSTDGIDRILTLDLGLVESASQAQRIAKQVLQRKQYQRSFSAPFDIRAWSWPVGAVVPFTFTPLGFDRRLFRVAQQEIGQDGTCNMTLSEESAAIYAWDADDAAPVQAAPAVSYDPTRSAIAQAIADTVLPRAAYQIVAQSADYPVTDTSTNIAIAAFNATLDDGSAISFPAGSVGGLTAATSYVVLWDRTTSTYSAVPAPALTQVGDSRYVIVRYYTTGNGDGTYPEQPTAPGGDGGSGYGGGYVARKMVDE